MDTNVIQKSCFFTGHRMLSDQDVRELSHLVRRICVTLIEKHGVNRFINGGAIGFDMMCADVVLGLKSSYDIELCMCLPCHDQSERWNKQCRMQYKNILNNADSVIYAVDGNYITGCMQLRNKMMVDDALYGIAYYSNGRSGTYRTLSYALDSGRLLTVIRKTCNGFELNTKIRR